MMIDSYPKWKIAAVRSSSDQWLTRHWGILLGCSRSRLWSGLIWRCRTGRWPQFSECSQEPWVWVPEDLQKLFASKFNSAGKHFPAQFYSPYVLLKQGFVDLSKNFHFSLKQSKFRKEVLSFSLLLCVWAIVEAGRFQCEVLFLVIDDAE